MSGNYTLTISDPDNILGSNYSLLVNDMAFVMNLLSTYIVFQAPLDIEIDLRPASQNTFNTDGLLPGNPAYVFYNGQETLAAMVKGQTNVDPNGSVPDAGFTIYAGNDGTLRNYGSPLWFDPNPQLELMPNIPVGSDDFVSIATHELVHCLGFVSWADANLVWNQHTVQIDGIWYYSSPAVQNLIGGMLPLDPNERPGQAGDHVGNTSLVYQPITSDLMYEWGNYASNRWDIGLLDLTILKDLGWSIQNEQGLPLVDPLDSNNIAGTDANDLIYAHTVSSMISSGAGDDTIFLPVATGNGNYLIDGGEGTDTLVVGQSFNQFNLVEYGNDHLLQSTTGIEGVSLLRSVERVQFTDQTIVLTNVVGETFVGGNGGQNHTGTGADDNLTGGNGKDVLNGGAGNDIISGGNGKDILTGGSGNDTLTGGNDADTLVFAANFGKDVITDFKPHEDVIQFDHTLFANFAAVQPHAANDGLGNTVITFDANDTITLQGVTVAQLHAGDFLFI